MTANQALSLFKKVGAVSFAPDTGASLDPGRDVLLALITAALNAELSDVFTVTDLGSSLGGATAPVGHTLKVGPDRQKLRLKPSGWPLLAVYRDEEPARNEQATLAHWHRIQQWHVDYVVGPVQDDQDEKRADFARAAASVMLLTLDAGRHPNYQSGKPCLGLGGGCAGFSWVRIVSDIVGQPRFADGDDMRYHAASIVLETAERDRHREGASAPIEGISVQLDVGDGQNLIPSLIEGDSDAPV